MLRECRFLHCVSLPDSSGAKLKPLVEFVVDLIAVKEYAAEAESWFANA